MKITNFNMIKEESLFSQIHTLIANAKEKIILIQSDYNAFINETNPLYTHIKQELNKKKDLDPNINIELNFLQGASKDNLHETKDKITEVKKFTAHYKNSFLKTKLAEFLQELQLFKELRARNKNSNSKFTTSYALKEARLKQLEKINNFLAKLEEDLLKLVDNIQESRYYEEEIKPLSKQSLQSIIHTIKENLKKTQNEDEAKKLLRALLKFFVGIVDGVFELKKISSLSKVYFFANTVLYEAYRAITEYQSSKDESFYYDLAVPLLALITSKLYPILAFCNEEFLADLLIIDDKILLDFSSYCDLPTYSLCRNSLYKISLDESAVGFFNSFFTQTKQDQNAYFNKDLLYSDKNSPNLKKLVQRNIQSLNHLFYAEYPDLNSALIVELIKEANKTQKKIKASKMGTNYLFITNPPTLYNAKLCEELYNKRLEAEILYRPKPPTKAQRLSLKDKGFPSKNSYSSYAIKRSVDDESPYILQLCPFVKLQDRAYKNYKKYNVTVPTSYYLELNKALNPPNLHIYEQEINNTAYLNSFFKLPKEIEEISFKEKEQAKAYFKAFQSYLNALSKQEAKQEHEYPLFNLFFISLCLYVFNKEFQGANKYKITSQRGIYFYQSIELSHIDLLTVMHVHSYYLDKDGNKIYVFLNKELNANKDKFLYLDELTRLIFEEEINEEGLSYCEFFKNLYDERILNEIKDQEKFKEALNEILTDEGLAKTAFHLSFFELIKHFFPFMSFFDSLDEFLDKLANFFLKAQLNKNILSFKEGFLGELGLVVNDLFIYKNPKLKIPTLKKHLHKQGLLTMIVDSYEDIVKDKQLIQNKASSYKKLDLLQARIKDLSGFSKQILKNSALDAIKDATKSFIDRLLPTHYDALKAEYDRISYEKFTYNFNAPLAVMQDEYMTYPMFVNSRFMSFDLARFIFGSLLCTGGLSHHPSLSCVTNLVEAKTFALQRLLSYLILDEKRATLFKEDLKQGKDMVDDLVFFAKVSNIELQNAKIYQLIDEEKEREYKKSGEKTRNEAILLYNEAISIICEYANKINAHINESLEDRQKARRLMKALDSIAQHNLKLMYKGVGDNDNDDSSNIKTSENINHYNVKETECDENEANNKFIGRLATVIIMENGLWIG
ncbi:hypothetical protein [Campylobacter troglodytis]|uniref:hypothetical protein n=1 Tax=Campylobacter troglodytis TaxID=654363 RepID=UPI00115A648E|nr:hypothetical protein [Campylobacter troglodytis]TQR53301.1 hypothetical protein DMC01_11425 [Campylobacter troglodytis]